MKIKKGDQVKIMTGKDRNKTGTVLRVDPETNRLTVEGLNLFSKKVRPKKAGQKGEIVSIPRPLSVSNVRMICKSCKNPVRLGFRFEGDKKVRYCKKCQATT
jgi:large subunit ribosomal protein L24